MNDMHAHVQTPLSDIKSARVFNAARGTMGVPMVFSLDLEGPWWFVFRTVKNDLRRAVTRCVGQECKVSSRSVTHRAGASVIRLQALADLTYNLKPVTWAKLLLYGKRKITVRPAPPPDRRPRCGRGHAQCPAGNGTG